MDEFNIQMKEIGVTHERRQMKMTDELWPPPYHAALDDDEFE